MSLFGEMDVSTAQSSNKKLTGLLMEAFSLCANSVLPEKAFAFTVLIVPLWIGSHRALELSVKIELNGLHVVVAEPNLNFRSISVRCEYNADDRAEYQPESHENQTLIRRSKAL